MSGMFSDDLYKLTSTPDEAHLIMSDNRKVLPFGGFNLTKRNSNDQSLLEFIDSSLLVDPENCKPHQQRVRGLPWDPITDTNTLDQNFFKSFSPKKKSPNGFF